MKQQPEESGALIAANIITLDDDIKIKGIRQKHKNSFYIVLLSVVLFALMWVYVQWQKVPTRKHYFRAEYISSVDTSRLLRAEFMLSIPRYLDLTNEDVDPLVVNPIEYYSINNLVVDSVLATPMNYYSIDSLANYIGLPASNKIKSYCCDKNIDTKRYSEIFLFRHLDNEKRTNKTKPTGILNNYDNNNRYMNDYFSFNERNYYTMTDFIREKKLGLNLLGFEQIIWKENETNISITGFRNITTSFILASHPKKTISHHITLPSKKNLRLGDILKMEDISQTKYSIKLRSASIPELKLKLFFGGSIECLYTQNHFVDFDALFKNSSSSGPNYINVGDDFIELLRTRHHGDLTFEARIQFIDMQNAQRMRLFVLTVIITFIFTTLVKLIWNAVFMSPSMKKKKNHSTIGPKHQKGNSVENNAQEMEDNIPGFYL